MNAEAYARQLKALLPRGPAWEHAEQGGVLDGFLAAFADELARIDGRAADLLREMDPRTTVELLDDWERVFGLPDECAEPTEDPISARRDNLVTKMVTRGGQSVAFFIELAEHLGHEITIKEIRPSRAGVLQAGDELVGDEEAVHAWEVTTTIENTYAFTSGVSVAGDELGYWRPLRLECVFDRAKPSQTFIVWNYVVP